MPADCSSALCLSIVEDRSKKSLRVTENEFFEHAEYHRKYEKYIDISGGAKNVNFKKMSCKSGTTTKFYLKLGI